MIPYLFEELPLGELDFRLLLPLVGQANAALARYDGLLLGIPNPAIMLSQLTTQEAVFSSKIEGIRATIDEVLEQEAGLLSEGEKHNDIKEISNYRNALLLSQNQIDMEPLRLSLVRNLHKILMDSARGKHKTPGKFRNDQNWIGPLGCTIEQATFIPPNPLQLPHYLERWEQYLMSDEIDALLQTAVMHAQFELLHPFKDGNGRIGRILIPLFLYQKKALSQPMFYLSEYLESHRDEYYQRLNAISNKGDWSSWIAFFLQAITTQATLNHARIASIIALYEEMKLKIHTAIRSQYSIPLSDAIFIKPIFRSSDLSNHLHSEFAIHEKTTQGFLRQMKDAGILTELEPRRGRRPATLCFSRLINIAKGHQII